MNKKKKQRVNIDIPIHIWNEFEKIWFNEKLANSNSTERTLKSKLLVDIIEKGIKSWKKRIKFLNR